MVVARDVNDTWAALSSSPGLSHAENTFLIREVTRRGAENGKGAPGRFMQVGGSVRSSRGRHRGRAWLSSRSQPKSSNIPSLSK